MRRSPERRTAVSKQKRGAKKKNKTGQDALPCEGLLIGSPEWHYAWGFLAGHTGDEDREAYNRACGESWSYLSSFQRAGRYWHEFRHRAHPVDNDRWIVHVPAREDWQPGAFKAQEWAEELGRRTRCAEDVLRDANEKLDRRLRDRGGVTFRVIDGDVASAVKH